jgi:hypothetical protein
MCPLGQLMRRVDRAVVLLVGAHSRSMSFQGVGRHAIVSIVGHQDIASKLDVVVLS